MKEPQDSLSNHEAIVHPFRPLLGLLGILLFESATLDPHLQLPPDHILVELHVPLGSKQPSPDIHALDLSVVALSPDMNLVPLRVQQPARASLLGRPGVDRVARVGRPDDLVEVHLVQVDVRRVRLGNRKETPPHGAAQGELGVRELPLVVSLGADLAAQRTAQDLVPEAYPREAHVGPGSP